MHVTVRHHQPDLLDLLDLLDLSQLGRPANIKKSLT
jgi:hypothetical protein